MASWWWVEEREGTSLHLRGIYRQRGQSSSPFSPFLLTLCAFLSQERGGDTAETISMKRNIQTARSGGDADVESDVETRTVLGLRRGVGSKA